FLEQHDALVGFVTEELQGGEAAGRRHVEMLPTARGYDEALCCVHVGVLSGPARPGPPSLGSVLTGPPAALGLGHLAQPLMEAPAVALGVERLVGAMTFIAPEVVAQPVGDPCTRGERALIVRIDVVDVHADVLALDSATLRADRAVVALGADPDHAVAELEHRMVDHAARAHEPRGQDLPEPERALQE